MFVILGADQSPEQHQPLLASSGNDTSSRHDSIDSHTSTDDGLGSKDHWSTHTRLVRITVVSFKSQLSIDIFVFCRTSPPTIQTAASLNQSSLLMNTAQPRPQAMHTGRQLPSLPIPIRKLPIVDSVNLMKPYFDIDDTESDDVKASSEWNRPEELFYYQTSSSSNSSNSSCSEQSGQDVNDGQYPYDNSNEADDNDDDAEQRLKSDDDDDNDRSSPLDFKL
jgi:hypothetical protein